jgi:hypothetical protein
MKQLKSFVVITAVMVKSAENMRNNEINAVL